MTLLAADVPYQSFLAVLRRVVDEDERASISSPTLDGIPGPQGEMHGVQITVLW